MRLQQWLIPELLDILNDSCRVLIGHGLYEAGAETLSLGADLGLVRSDYLGARASSINDWLCYQHLTVLGPPHSQVAEWVTFVILHFVAELAVRSTL